MIAATEEERKNNGFLHQLLTASGPELVAAVRQTLGVLGFRSVIDVDQELTDGKSKVSRREDLQIQDHSPILLVEIKGIGPAPSIPAGK